MKILISYIFLSEMSKKLTPNRQAVIKALQQKFSVSKAKTYEEELHKMCQNLGETTFDESVDEIYKYYAYEKVGQLMAVSESHLQEVINDIKNSQIGEGSFYRRKLDSKKLNVDDKMIRSGVFPCLTRGCRSRHTKETIFRMEQRRSGDEGMTAIVSCRICKEVYTL